MEGGPAPSCMVEVQAEPFCGWWLGDEEEEEEEEEDVLLLEPVAFVGWEGWVGGLEVKRETGQRPTHPPTHPKPPTHLLLPPARSRRWTWPSLLLLLLLLLSLLHYPPPSSS